MTWALANDEFVCLNGWATLCFGTTKRWCAQIHIHLFGSSIPESNTTNGISFVRVANPTFSIHFAELILTFVHHAISPLLAQVLSCMFLFELLLWCVRYGKHLQNFDCSVDMIAVTTAIRKMYASQDVHKCAYIGTEYVRVEIVKGAKYVRSSN